MIDPQSINPSLLPSVFLTAKNELPKCCGIYFVVNSNNEVIYIGRSYNLRQRWAAHHKYQDLEGLDPLKIAWLEISDNSLLQEIETALIDWFKPSLNCEFNESGKRGRPKGIEKVEIHLRVLPKTKEWLESQCMPIGDCLDLLIMQQIRKDLKEKDEI